MGEDSPKERLRLRLRELGLPLNGRRSDDISLRKLSEAMDISLQHENGNRKKGEELVEALITALLREVPVLGNFHESFVEKSLRDLRQVRDGLSGQADEVLYPKSRSLGRFKPLGTMPLEIAILWRGSLLMRAC